MAFAFNPITGKLDLVGSGGGGNPFDQSLNTGDSVNFASVTTAIPEDNFSYITTSGVGGGNNNNGASWSFDSSGNGSVSGSFACSSITVSGQSPSYLGVANTFTARQSITAPANTSALTASYSVTGANTTPLLDLSGTWNTSGAAQGILLNITRTAASDASTLLALRVGGAQRFSVIDTANASPTISVGGSGTNWNLRTRQSAGAGCNLDTILGLGASLQFLATANSQGGGDVVLVRDGAANTFAQRNGTAAQTFRLYNTFTDASNYERGFMRWNSNVLEIGTEAGGTGANREFRIVTNGTTQVTIGTGTNFNSSVSFSQFITNLGAGVAYKSQATDPTTANISSGFWQIYRNTTTGALRIWVNNNGTMQSLVFA